MKSANPWKGLESYKENEKLYGRNNEIEELYSRILLNVQTVVYGRSGIGKSSLINAGILPKARKDGMLPVCIRLSHNNNDSKGFPNDYAAQIKNAIAEEIKRLGGKIDEIVKHDNKHEESLWEYFHRHVFKIPKGDTYREVMLLVVLDQFEEIFTLVKKRECVKGFFDQLADLLNDIKPQYITDSLQAKSDTEGNATPTNDSIFDFDDLPESPDYIDTSNFHVVISLRADYLAQLEYATYNIPSLRINRYFLQPLNEEQAANIITKPIEKLVDENVAHRIIEKITGRTDFKLGDAPEIEVDSAILSLFMHELYEQVEENAVITEDMVTDSSKNILQEFYERTIQHIKPESRVFLEDKLVNEEERRENTSINTAKKNGVSEEDLAYLDSSRLIRIYEWNGQRRIELMHDVLCPIIANFKQEREEQEEQEKLIREAQEQQERLIKYQKRVRRRYKRITWMLVTSVFALLITAAGVYALFYMTVDKYYASFTIKNGWPVGVGKVIRQADKDSLTQYYRLSRKGWWPGEFEKVEILKSGDEKANNVLRGEYAVGLDEATGNDERAKYFALTLRNISYWKFSKHNDNSSHATAFDIRDNELFSMQFYKPNAVSGEDNGVKREYQWITYVDGEGKSLKLRDNGTDRMLVSLSNGYVTKIAFYNELGVPQSNKYGVFGYETPVDEEGRVIGLNSLNAFGIKTSSVKYERFDDMGRWVKSSSGYARYTRKRIEYGGRKGFLTWNFTDSGQLLSVRQGIDKTVTEAVYDKLGRLCQIKTLKNDSIVSSEQTTYTSRGKVDNIVRFNSSLPQMPYRLEKHTYGTHTSQVAFFKGEKRDNINIPDTVSDQSGSYHKVIDRMSEDGTFKIITRKYYEIDGSLCKDRKYHTEETYLNADGKVAKNIQTGTHGIYKSYAMEYENGQLVAQYALGLDRKTPVRCPNWDYSGLCYYKLRLIRDFMGHYLAFYITNEWEDKSEALIEEFNIYNIEVAKQELIEYQDNSITKEGYQTNIKIANLAPSKNLKKIVHILSYDGSWHKGGLRDGDILLNETIPDNSGGQCVIARRVNKGVFKMYKLKIGKGTIGAETHNAYLNDAEIEKINKLQVL